MVTWSYDLLGMVDGEKPSQKKKKEKKKKNGLSLRIN